MTLIEPTRYNPENKSAIKKHSAALRLWHWANAAIISGSLITVLINSTILKSRNMAPFVQAEMQKDGATITLEQARTAVHSLSDKVWDFHVYFGYGLAAFFIFRLIAEFFQFADQKFINQFKTAWKQFFVIKQQREKAQHELVVKSIYIVFYILLLIMVVTGLCLAFDDYLTFLKPAMRGIKSVHGFCMYPILAFIAVHIIGVFLAERKDSKGIVSDMINGG